MPTGAVHVWASDLTSVDPARYFLHTADLTPKNGAYTVTGKLSGKVMDVYQAPGTPGTKVIQYHATGRPNQQWNLLRRRLPEPRTGSPPATCSAPASSGPSRLPVTAAGR